MSRPLSSQLTDYPNRTEPLTSAHGLTNSWRPHHTTDSGPDAASLQALWCRASEKRCDCRGDPTLQASSDTAITQPLLMRERHWAGGGRASTPESTSELTLKQERGQ